MYDDTIVLYTLVSSALRSFFKENGWHITTCSTIDYSKGVQTPLVEK